MILIFLGNWRMTVIATISIPVSVLGAIIGIYVTGNTINVMTLGGLALGDRAVGGRRHRGVGEHAPKLQPRQIACASSNRRGH